MAAVPSTETPPAIFSSRRLADLDVALSLRVYTACLPIPRCLLKALEISGDGLFWFPILIFVFSFCSRSPILLGLILGTLLDLVFVGFIKHLVRRPRPLYNKGMHLTFSVDHWSFPSGHSSRAFFIAVFLNLCSKPFQITFESHRWVHDYFGGVFADLFILIVCVWSAATSASRVLLGRHFVLDVISGACLGLFEALLVFRLMKI